MERECDQARDFLRQEEIAQSMHKLMEKINREGNSTTKERREICWDSRLE